MAQLLVPMTGAIAAARASAVTERRPLPPHQLEMPTENRFRLDQHPDQRRPAHSPAQCGRDCPVRHVQLRPLHLAPHYAQLVAQEQQLGLGVTHPQPHIEHVEEKAHDRIGEGEQHPRRDPSG